MGRFNKKLNIIVLLIGIILLTGCDKFRFNTFNASEDKTKTEVTIAPEATQDAALKSNKITSEKSEKNSETANITMAEDSVTPTSSEIQPEVNIELPVYTVNADTEEVESVTALIPKKDEITPEIIVNKTVEALADQSIMIGIDRVTTKDDSVIVSFLKDKAPYTNMGSGYEEAILNAIAYSLIENLDEYNKVIYQVEGKAYSGGAFEMGIDEPYLEDN